MTIFDSKFFFMGRVLLLTILFYIPLRNGYYFPVDVLFSLLLGTLFWVGYGIVQIGFLNRCDQRIVESALREEKLVDAKRIAVIGKIKPIGDQLIAPFSRKPCSAYCYQIYHCYRRINSTTTSGSYSASSRPVEELVYAGYALIPSVIQTTNGDIKLMGFPYLEGFAESKQKNFKNAHM